MWKWIFCLPFLLFSEELEVKLHTLSEVKPVYLVIQSGDPDWRAASEMEKVLEFDLNLSGVCLIAPQNPKLSTHLQFPDPREGFDTAAWKRENIPFLLAGYVQDEKLTLFAFYIDKKVSKKYPPIPLSRRSIHKLADQIQKDLFNHEGIASKRLIYTERRKNPQKGELEFLSEIWISDSDGENREQITEENSYCLCPSFLPNSSQSFCYASEKTGQSKIYRASFDHPNGKLFVSLRGNQALPTLSQDGKCLAFISDVAGRPDLFVQRLDKEGNMLGKARQLFTAPRATQASPTFSPDGKKVAFVSDKDGPPRIYVLDVVGPKNTKKLRPQLLTRRNRENTSPAWSPDGSKLAYSAKVDGVRQIWIYDFATQEEFALTTGGENKENPAWAPNSFHIVYNTESKDSCSLYITHLKAKEPVKISRTNAQMRFASWSQ